MAGIRVQASCLIIKDNRIAMIKKTNPSYKTFNQYIPPGGHVEHLEKLEKACIREVEEETGLLVSDLELRGVVTFLKYVSGYHSVCFFFYANTVRGELVSNEPDKQTSHWLDIDEITTNNQIPDYHRAFLKKMLIDKQYLNAQVEWLPPNEQDVQWRNIDNQMINA